MALTGYFGARTLLSSVSLRYSQQRFLRFFSSHETYSGSSIEKDGKMIKEGFGTFKCDSWTYSGDWKNNQRHGFGKCLKGELEEYVGEWKNDRKHGWGKLRTRHTHNEPWRVYGYNGQFEDDYQHGVGYTAMNNPPYVEKTYWYKGIKVQHGQNVVGSSDQIKAVHNDGLREGYTGEYVEKNGVQLRHGKGTQIYPEGDKYVGDWVNDQRHGWGEFTNAFFDTYKGQWKNDVREGRGEAVYAHGGTYDGEWKNSNYHGKGKMSSPCSGSILEGIWLDNVMCGSGMEISTKGVYEGNFLDTVWCGQGKFTDHFGNVSIGLWFDGKLNGFGSKFDVHGKLIEEGMYVDNKLQRDI